MASAARARSVASGRARGIDPGPRLEQLGGPVPGLGLDVLGQRQRHGARLGRRGQHPHGGRQGVDEHLRPLDAVEVARHRAQRVVDRDVAGLGSLELLEHGLDASRGEAVAGQEQHGQAVDGGVGGPGHEVRGARADGRRAGERAQAAALLGEGRRRVDHGLLVARLVVAHAALGRLEGLAHAGHDAVAEDAEDALEEALPAPVTLDMLVGQPGHDGLGDGGSRHRAPPPLGVPCRLRPCTSGFGDEQVVDGAARAPSRRR